MGVMRQTDGMSEADLRLPHHLPGALKIIKKVKYLRIL